MTEVIVPIILGVIASGGMWTFIQFLVNRRDEKKKQKADKSNEIAKTVDETQKALTELSKAVSILQTSVDQNNHDMALQNEALMSIAQDRIVWLSKQYIKQGWVYDDDICSLRRMADAYRSLGGNALVKVEMDKVDKLEVRAK